MRPTEPGWKSVERRLSSLPPWRYELLRKGQGRWNMRHIWPWYFFANDLSTCNFWKVFSSYWQGTLTSATLSNHRNSAVVWGPYENIFHQHSRPEHGGPLSMSWLAILKLFWRAPSYSLNVYALVGTPIPYSTLQALLSQPLSKITTSKYFDAETPTHLIKRADILRWIVTAIPGVHEHSSPSTHMLNIIRLYCCIKVVPLLITNHRLKLSFDRHKSDPQP